jgi:hypothetical protein
MDQARVLRSISGHVILLVDVEKTDLEIADLEHSDFERASNLVSMEGPDCPSRTPSKRVRGTV